MAIGGKLTDFRFGTHGALTTLTDFTAKTRNLSIKMSNKTVDATVFGSQYEQYEMSFIGATISWTAKVDDTLIGQLGDLFTNQETVSFQLSPNGTASGKPKITGSMFIVDFPLDFATGTLEEAQIQFQVTGAFPFSTF